MRAALQYCHAESPRPCIVYLTSDSSEVGAGSAIRGHRAFIAITCPQLMPSCQHYALLSALALTITWPHSMRFVALHRKIPA